MMMNAGASALEIPKNVLVKATFTGLREANPPDYYKHIPSWGLPQDIILAKEEVFHGRSGHYL